MVKVRRHKSQKFMVKVKRYQFSEQQNARRIARLLYIKIKCTAVKVKLKLNSKFSNTTETCNTCLMRQNLLVFDRELV